MAQTCVMNLQAEVYNIHKVRSWQRLVFLARWQTCDMRPFDPAPVVALVPADQP
jgi:hypothetical protein